tara:strand:+ start:773 stop:1063 length:291 start_codon:yes stop_codon:yes gene_type:complete
MEVFKAKFNCREENPSVDFKSNSYALKKSLSNWQQVRSWARLIREAEKLWHHDEKELKRLGALELSQILNEIPYSHKSRINKWLDSYYVSTRLNTN